MLRNIHFLIISMLFMVTAHTEIRSTMPDFSKADTVSLAPIEVDHVWTTAISTKNKLFSEKADHLIYSRQFVVVDPPTVQPFVKRSFIQQTQVYYSYQIKSFHLLI